MFIKYTENFKPCDPSTHERFEKGEKLQGMIVAIKTPQGQLVPYSPEDHNDPTREGGIKAEYDLLPMCYKTYCLRTKEARDSKKQAEASRNPTPEEIAILLSEKVDAYVADVFDPNKKDENEKYHQPKYCREDQILVLKKKIFGGGHKPYIPSKHGDNPTIYKPITVSYYRSENNKAKKLYEQSKKKNAPKFFNPILLVHDFEQIQSEYKQPAKASQMEASQTITSTAQRKRAADDGALLNHTSSRNVFNLFQEITEPALLTDPKPTKRWRPWE